jgi:hypothetical protein
MKKLILLITLISFSQISFSQQAGKFRFGLDIPGVAIPSSGGGGISIGIEPKYNISNHVNVGLKLGLAGMAKEVDNKTADATISTSIGITSDFYLHKSGKFATFLGAGFAQYSLGNAKVALVGQNVTELVLGNKTGAMIRAGFELGKFRLSGEYNILADSDVNSKKIKNSYATISLGFYVGGGKWNQSK